MPSCCVTQSSTTYLAEQSAPKNNLDWGCRRRLSPGTVYPTYLQIKLCWYDDQKNLPRRNKSFRWPPSPTLPPRKSGPKAVSTTRPTVPSIGREGPCSTPYALPIS